MSFDLSRIRFDARKDFFGLVVQQGRIQLDAEWNEWVAQLGRRLQAGTLDTFNGNVVPRITPDGFRIQASGGALSIGQSVSSGCIRMRNIDVIDLYNRVKMNSKVVVL